jgi:tetraacyldisaccharide 4'-kinase
MHIEEVWTGKSFKNRLLRTILTPASWLYALGWRLYLAVYQLGFKKAKQAHSPVVCIGNLQVGGTGKTPATIHVADVLIGLGRQVVVSCSGYGSKASEAARLAPQGPLQASQWGDEAALIRMLRPSIPLIVGRRRVLAAEICSREFPDSVMLMDDGFQHLPLHKDITIILDPPQPNKNCLPAGPYREPLSGRNRASLLIPGTQTFRMQAKPTQFRTPSEGSRELGGSIDVLCALGRPQRFIEGLLEKGLKIRTEKLLPDHDPLTDGNLLDGLEGPIVVTRKDWVKLRERGDVESFDIVIADREITIEPAEDFRIWLQTKLNGIQKKTV